MGVGSFPFQKKPLAVITPNKALQPTVLPPLRYGKTAAELER